MNERHAPAKRARRARAGAWSSSALVLAPLIACGPEASERTTDDASTALATYAISQTVFGSSATLGASSRTAGSIGSFVFRGVQYVDAYDHGREIQCAASFDRYGECYNPTEGGGRYDARGPTSTSDLLNVSTAGGVLRTVSNMAFWLAPGTDYGTQCGSSNVHFAQNQTYLAGYLMTKRVAIGFEDIPNVIDFSVTFHVPRDHEIGTFEAPTGYMPGVFSVFYTYDTATHTLAPLSDGPGEQNRPVILATPDGRNAMGVFSPELPEWNTGYGRFRFNSANVTKWSCVFRRSPMLQGDHDFRCYVAFGTLSEVTSALDGLDAKFSAGRVLGQIQSVALDATGTQATIRGWACARRIDAPISVQLYAGGPIGFGVPVATQVTSLPSNATIAANCESHGTAYGFRFVLGASDLERFHEHPLFVYGLTPNPDRNRDLLLRNPSALTVPCGTGLSCGGPPALDLSGLSRGSSRPIYRFFRSGDHLLTLNHDEGVAAGFDDEGVGFRAYSGRTAGMSSINRCFRSRDHYVSNDATCEGAGRLEGLYGYLFDAPAAGHHLAVRFRSPSTGQHLSTINPSEGVAAGLVREGNHGYAPPASR